MQAVRADGVVVEVEEVRRARPATGEVLVRVGAVAVDRRDGELDAGPCPMRPDTGGRRTLGRHVVGTVAVPGAGVDGWPLGRPVAVQPETALRRAWHVPGVEHEGGLAEYIAAPAEALVMLPRDLWPTDAVVLPLAARAHSMLCHARLQLGESVSIWGAGSLGGSALAVARAMGAAPIVVVDPDPAARRSALDLGADVAVDPSDDELIERLVAVTGRGVDVALHTAPDAGAVEQVVASLAPDGRGILAGPVAGLRGSDRWDARTLSGPPRVGATSLPLLAHLAHQGRLRLPTPPELPGGLSGAAEALAAAVRGDTALTPRVLIL